MITVKSYLDKSKVHGIGVFADTEIKKGTVVWKFNPLVDLVFTKNKWFRLKNKLNKECFEELEKYSYKQKNKFYLCIDNGQFMNHGIKNCNLYNDFKTDTLVAVKDIKKGEELICNYYEFCDEDDKNLTIIKSLNLDN